MEKYGKSISNHLTIKQIHFNNKCKFKEQPFYRIANQADTQQNTNRKCNYPHANI